MGKKSLKIHIIFLVMALVAVFCIGIFVGDSKRTDTVSHLTPTHSISADRFSYSGGEGRDALSILKEKTIIEQDSSGMVSSINGRKALEKNREFWSFYVNGKLAEMGAADYITKPTDKIEWKIDTY